MILFIILGYFIFFGWLMARADNRWSVSSTLMTALLVYVPVLFIAAAAGRYLGEAGLLLYGAAAVYCCFYWLWKIYRLRRHRPHLRLRILFAFAAYLLAVLYITVFMRKGGSDDRVQMELFGWAEAGYSEGFRHVFQNVALFIPVGLLYALLPKEGKKVFVSGASFGLLLSVLIETLQLLFRFGICDIDDILSNFLGAAIGAAAVAIWNRIHMRDAIRTEG